MSTQYLEDLSDDGVSDGSEIELMDLLAYIYLENGRADKAAVLMAARDMLCPDDGGALMRLAVALVRSNKPLRALATLERLALIGAMNTTFHLVRAQALQALDRKDEAASAMRAYVALRSGKDAAVTPTRSSAESSATLLPAH